MTDPNHHDFLALEALAPDIRARAARVRLIALDVDGVLTDGSINLDDEGREFKRFNVRDGLGIVTWLKLGHEAAIVTRRSGGVVSHRARELGIKHVVQGSKDKAAALEALSQTTGIGVSEMAFVGDDWPDLPALRVAGLAAVVGDADPLAKRQAHLVLRHNGGAGAVRELIELILCARGEMGKALEGY